MVIGKQLLMGLVALYVNSVQADVQSSVYDIAMTGRWFAHSAAQLDGEELYRADYGMQAQAKLSGSVLGLPWRLEAFANWASQDSQRRYLDLREATLSKQWSQWQVSAGVTRLFWGVAESINIVNLVNQADIRESLDGKEKLGQSVVSVQRSFELAEIGIWYFPEFRPRDYGQRPWYGLPISESERYEDDEKNGGWAIRGNYYFDAGEWALGVFDGTRRAPVLIKNIQRGQLQPLYIQTQNVLFDGIYMGEFLSSKLEMKWGKELDDSFFASNVGVEYPVYPDVFDIQELMLIAEYLYDTRESARESHGQNDLFLGGKLTMGGNSELKLLASHDFDYGSQYIEVNGLHRINDYWRIKFKAMGAVNVDKDDSELYPLKDESFLKMSIHYAF